ncbi:MAG: BON domain-containing protein [Planctomycetales bacterium]|nr:BON domain-containing protein [Planctomycetales bacterium]
MKTTSASLHEKLIQAIDAAPHLSRHQLRIETEQGHVIVRGTVGTFFQKQMAQEALRTVDGVEDIENALEVAWN